jgi:hypothetical protein
VSVLYRVAYIMGRKHNVTLLLSDVYALGNRRPGDYDQVIATCGVDCASENKRASFASHSLVFDATRVGVDDCLDGYNDPVSDPSGKDYVDGL